MKDLIAYCGLNCKTCEARLATVRDDDALREKVASLWSELNGVTITPAMIHCSGCRLDGPKTPFCESICPIRKCAREKAFETCADCEVMETCEKLGMIFRSTPEARGNLRALSEPADQP